ncbi:hypothetical protein BK138_34510 [Paenibacillus rhizosphaerae]|uniref:Uncharacterized protein n=1 Tax=Paenibacillus rhizosphaerae TaxID=297318 RepID=A0A1R1DYS8_9BACL|nr:hypothetical protein [Paenibacillus rhizosphaerae]OMF44754.1 hypothetical protein BK138_34510 [Paenibacillus rhizosphaerae]
MNKKIVLFTAIPVLLLAIGGYVYLDNTNESKKITFANTAIKGAVSSVTKEEKISADHLIFKNYSDALSSSQVVAEVTATDNSKNVIVEENGYSTGHTVTAVQVNQVFENSGKELGQTINILEPTYTSEGVSGTTRFNYEDYKKMEPGSRYVVFLVWDEKKQGYWINALEQGKFNIDNKDKAEMSLLAENSQYQELKNDVINHLYGDSSKTN